MWRETTDRFLKALNSFIDLLQNIKSISSTSSTSENENLILKFFSTLTCFEFLFPQSSSMLPFGSEANERVFFTMLSAHSNLVISQSQITFSWVSEWYSYKENHNHKIIVCRNSCQKFDSAKKRQKCFLPFWGSQFGDDTTDMERNVKADRVGDICLFLHLFTFWQCLPSTICQANCWDLG